VTCQQPIGPVSFCSLLALPGTDRCQSHQNCFLCAKPLGEEIAHPAAPARNGAVQWACHSCFSNLMARFPPKAKSKLPACDGCGAEFGAGCSCARNSRAIGRGERREP